MARLTEPGVAFFLIAATTLGIYFLFFGDHMHRTTKKAYESGILAKIGPLADWHKDPRELIRIRVTGALVLAFVGFIIVWILRGE